MTDIEQKLVDVRNGRDLSVFDVCSIDDLSDDDIALIFEVATAFKENFANKFTFMKGTSIFNAFFENSTRTRASFELGGKKLGSDTINIMGKGTSLGKGESLHDTAQTLDALGASVINVRTEYSGVPQFLAKHVAAAIINAGDGMHEHPTQGLLDAFTMVENKGDLKGQNILVIGDISHSRVFGSLVRITKRLGANVRVAAPRTFIRNGFEEAFGVPVHFNVEEVLPDTDIIVALRVQEERGGGHGLPTLREFSKAFGVNERRFAMAKDGAILMHPGPVMRDIEVHNALMTRDSTRILNQVENGMAIRMALQWMLGMREDGKKKQYTPV